METRGDPARSTGTAAQCPLRAWAGCFSRGPRMMTTDGNGAAAIHITDRAPRSPGVQDTIQVVKVDHAIAIVIPRACVNFEDLNEVLAAWGSMCP